MNETVNNKIITIPGRIFESSPVKKIEGGEISSLRESREILPKNISNENSGKDFQARDYWEDQLASEEQLAEARELALVDSLTGLPNRIAFESNMKAIEDKFIRDGIPYTLVFADFNGFKELNDKHGHHKGDRGLQIIGQVAREMRGVDEIFRLGGDEFPAILTESDAEGFCSRLGNEFEKITSRENITEIRELSISFGYATREVGESLKDFQERADNAMYEAKKRKLTERFPISTLTIEENQRIIAERDGEQKDKSSLHMIDHTFEDPENPDLTPISELTREQQDIFLKLGEKELLENKSLGLGTRSLEDKDVSGVELIILGQEAYYREWADQLHQERLITETRGLAFKHMISSLPNKRDLDREIKKLDALWQREKKTIKAGEQERKTTVAIIKIDLNNFKKINDNFGHTEGDEALKLVGNIIKNTCRDYDYPAHPGGDEFEIILNDPKNNISSEDARKFCHRLTHNLDKAIVKSKKEAFADLKMSFGVAICSNEHGEDALAGQQRADAALYQAKKLKGLVLNPIVALTQEEHDGVKNQQWVQKIKEEIMSQDIKTSDDAPEEVGTLQGGDTVMSIGKTKKLTTGNNNKDEIGTGQANLVA